MPKVGFRVVEKGNGAGSSMRAFGYVLVKDALEWISLWNKINSRYEAKDGEVVQVFDAPPLVDFENEFVVAVFRGQCPTSGYGVKVVSVVEDDSVVRVRIRFSGGRGMAMVITYPYEIVALPKTEKRVLVELA